MVNEKKLGITFEDATEVLTQKILRIGSKSLLNQLEMMKTQFFKNSFNLVDANKDGFITGEELEKYELANSAQKFKSLVIEAFKDALKVFKEKKDQNLVEKEKLGISFEDSNKVLNQKLQKNYN